MKLNSLTIASATIANNGQFILSFKGFPGIEVWKPASVLLLSLSKAEQAIVMLDASVLVGATLKTSTQTIGDKVTNGLIETHKAGETYALTEVSSKVVRGDINPTTNAPYQIGEMDTFQKDGIRIEGRMAVELHPIHKSMIQADIRQLAIRDTMDKNNATKQLSALKASLANAGPEPENAEEDLDNTDKGGEDAEKVISDAVNGGN